MNLDIRRVGYFDCYTLAKHIRQADKEEIWAARGLTPIQGVEWSVGHSDASYGAFVDGVLVAIWGIASLPNGGGAPWLLATEDLRKYAIRFYHITREHISQMLEAYGYLENYVDARNIDSIRWLKWLGFEFDELQPYGYSQLPFRRFHMGGD